MMMPWHEKNEQGIDVLCDYNGGSGSERVTTYVHEDTVADLLAYAAADMAGMGCAEPFCTYCNPARAAWWKACNSLSVTTRRGLQALMRDAGVELPEAPYEEETEGVVPTAQHG